MHTKIMFCSMAMAAALPVAMQANAGDPPQTRGFGLATPVVEVNSTVADGCPIEAPDGLSLYIASVRPGTAGGNDIWASDRLNKEAPWSTPKNLGAPVNTEFNDFCPTPLDGRWLMFVSERPGEGTCNSGAGRGDIYLIRQNAAYGWSEPQHLGCIENGTGPNSAGAEFSPSLVKTRQGTFLYFSSTATGNHDIYKSRQRSNGTFEAPVPVTELNTAFDDRMPNISPDGLEIVFSSTRPADANGTPGFGSFDVYVATRASTTEPFSIPVNLGANVNTAGSETRSSISADRKRLYFGRDGEIYSAKRLK